ncbi:polyphosphate polymerase domain-containing protein [Mycoplasmatota bacterium WC44]
MKSEYRYEYKYIVDERKNILLTNHINELMKVDDNIKSGNKYHTRSLYFDDIENSAYFSVLSGEYKRTKYRIRIYNWNDNEIYLEEKNKEGEFVYKNRSLISLEEYNKIIKGDISFLLKKCEMCRRFYIKLRNELLKPRIIIDYYRKPFYLTHSDLRITFDFDITVIMFKNNFFNKDSRGFRISEPNTSILEVKYKKFLPTVFRKLFSGFDISRTNYSKYYLSFEYLRNYKLMNWDVK